MKMSNPTKRLLAATENGDLAAVKAALAAGADVNACDKVGMSPLLIACFNGFTQIAKALVAAGADIALRNRHQWTPLSITVHGAAMAPEGTRGVKSPRSHVTLLKFLLAQGGDAREKYRGETLLEMAEGSIYTSPRPEKLIPILKRAGSKSRSEEEMIEDGDIEILEPPDFSKSAKRPEFIAAVKRFTARFGKPVKGLLDNVVVFKSTLSEAEKTVMTEQSRLLTQGVFLCRTSDFLESGAQMALFPTGDVYEALAAVEVGGGYEGVAAAVRRLREIAADDPFKLTLVAPDALEGEFLAPPKDAARLAERLYELCPDINGEADDTSRLARQLKKSRQLSLWWD
jgi:hypothetical protein